MTEFNDQTTTLQDPLEARVRKHLETHGEEFEGRVWAIQPLQDWADQAGVSLRTVKRRFAKAPYYTLCKQVEGRQALLVRIGVPDPNQPSRLASDMAKAFRKGILLNEKVNAKQQAKALKAGTEWKPKKGVTPAEYGCLIGLAKDWRAGWQLPIFKYAISADGWKAVKVLSKYKTEDLEPPLCDTGGILKLKPGKAHLFQAYPHIPTLRLFWKYAETAFVDDKLGKLKNPVKITVENPDNDKLVNEWTYFLKWWEEVAPVKLVDWEPNWKATIDPIKDVKG